MRTVVTGGTGFIGGAVARRLLSRGDEVVILARPPERAPEIAAAGARIVQGDLLDGAALARAMAGADVVVHCAGHPRPGSWRLLRRVHNEGTRGVVEAARRAGVRRVVNIASQAVVFAGKDLLDVDESCPYPTRFIDPYSATKAEAERIALELGRQGSVEVVSVRPGVVWGRGDTTILPIMLRLAMGPLGIPTWGDGRCLESTSHIDSVVDGILAAMTAPRAAGRAYFVGDGFEVGWREFYRLMVEAAGARARFCGVPRGVAVGGAWVVDRAAGALGLPVPLARFGVAMALTSRRFSCERARVELGYAPRVGLEEGLADLGRWVEERGGAAAVARRRR